MNNTDFPLKAVTWLRKYAVLIILVVTLATELGQVIANGMGPRPQLPPNGYVVEHGVVTLQWNKGNIDAPITLQISKSRDFDELLVDTEVSAITYNYANDLERGATYYWRLKQNDHFSTVASFVVSAQHVKL